jgi:hypothetical protein
MGIGLSRAAGSLGLKNGTVILHGDAMHHPGRLAHGRETRVVELRKIDTGDFGADGGRDSADVESKSGHGDAGLLCAAWRCLYVQGATI